MNNLSDGFNHLQAHVDAVVGVIWPGNWQTTHAIVAIAENLNPHALVLLEIYNTYLYFYFTKKLYHIEDICFKKIIT